MFQAWAMLEEERADVRPSDRSPARKRADEALKVKRESESGAATLSAELAARVSGMLLPSAVTLLEALVASSRLESAMTSQQGAVCQCMGQAVAQVNSTGMKFRTCVVVLLYTAVVCWLLLKRERGPCVGGGEGGQGVLSLPGPPSPLSFR